MDASLLSVDRETLELWLSEARVARHEILSGKRASYTQNGEQARTFNHGNIEHLAAYIRDLDQALKALDNGSSLAGPIHYGMGF